jgi:RHS repeat-associated protein
LNYLAHKTEGVNRTQAMRFYPFTFTGKEKDEETGYGYFGARYMDHELTTMWLSVDPMADKYPNVSPYAYCAWNPVKLVDPDGREIHIVGDKKYQTKVIALLNQLANSGLAGKYLVHEALKLEKTFTFIQPRDNSSFEEDAINRNGKNGEISFILFDAYSSGTFDEANGGVEKTPLTTMAHELAHFVFPNNGHILMDNGYNGGPAGEVKAVEWENMVREDLGMPLRRKYAGMDVFGKEISPTKQYEKSYTLTKKKNYMQRPEDVGGFRAPRENLKRINPYHSGSRIVNPPINSTECKFKL